MAGGGSSSVQALWFGALLLGCLLAPLALIFMAAGLVNTLWDWANVMGYLFLALVLLLFVYRGRVRSFPRFSGRFFANLHRDMGYIAVLLLAGHVGLLLIIEPLLIDYLKPTAPLSILAGLIALVLMLALLVSSVPVLRRRLWPDYHLFRHVHRVMAVAILALVLFHVVTSGFYLDSALKTGVLSVLVIAAFVSSVGGGRADFAVSAARFRDSARYSQLITYSSVLVVLVLSLGALLLPQTK